METHTRLEGEIIVKRGKGNSYEGCGTSCYIPTYAMFCFDLTKSFCDELSSMIANYWWSQEDKGKMHWLSLDKVMLPKGDRGLGFKDLHAFNMAMLAKQ